MSRINTNVQSLIAQRVLSSNNMTLNRSLERLSTGFRINRGKDDPAGLIASENLRSDIKAINQAVSNAERADQVVNIAEGGLQEISSLLTELQGLLTAAANKAGLSQAEKEANQLQVDSILQTIDRISNSTEFQGTKLLNGNYDYAAESVDSAVKSYSVNGAKFDGDSLDVEVIITASAQQAGLFLSTGGALDLSATTSLFVMEIAGTEGSREFSFASGTTLTAMANAINTFTDVTGVAASVSGTGLRLETEGYGSSNFINVKVNNTGGISGSAGRGIYQLSSTDFNRVSSGSATAFASANNGVRDTGQNVGAIVNGILATTNGLNIRANTDFLDVSMTLSAASAQTPGSIDAFTITGGGADFQLAADVNIAGKVSLGIQDVSSRKLGDQSIGFLSELGNGKAFNLVSGNNLGDAQKIVDSAIDNITSLRGRLGAFQKNTLGSTIRSLQITSENTQAAESAIRDTDFAKETAELTRSQILVASATNILALANQAPQSALQLLG